MPQSDAASTPRLSLSDRRCLASAKANFKMASKGGKKYIRGIPPLRRDLFTIKSNRVILRPGITPLKALARIRSGPTYKHDPVVREAAKDQYFDKQMDRAAKKSEREGDFDPKNAKEGREKIERAITLRRGQPQFRKKLLEAYGGRCAITDCDCPDGLEAAHILPYRGDDTNHIQNGILLRSDIHTLFDIGKIGFAPISHKVVITKSLSGTVYGKLKGKKLRVPSQQDNRPNEEALRQHLESCRLKSPQVQ